jgi:hypothetical protein
MGGLVDGNQVRSFALTRGEKSSGLVRWGAVARQQRTEGEVTEMERGVVHVFKSSRQFGGFRIG